MNCNLSQARPRAPKEWERLPDRDKHIIIQHLKEKVMEELEKTLIPDLVRINLDHEEAELQKTWLKLLCIVMHEEHGHGEVRSRRTLRKWKRIYHDYGRIKSQADRDEWMNDKIGKIFRKSAYPDEWVDSLEEGGRRWAKLS